MTGTDDDRRGDRPRIAFVTAAGMTVTSFLMPQLAALREAGATVMVAAGGDDWLRRVAAGSGAEVLPLPISRSRMNAGDIAAIWKLIRWFRRRRPDVVVGSTPKGLLYGMLGGAAAGVRRRIAYYRGLVSSSGSGMARWLGRRAERTAAGLATEHVAVSPSLLAEARRLGVLGAGQGIVLGEGMSRGVNVAALRLQAAEAMVDLGGISGRRFIWVGRCAGRKGFDALAAAWPRIRSELPGATLTILGDRDASDPPVTDVAAWAASDESVRLVGWRENVGAWLGGADVLLFPSDGEGFPNAPMEAAALMVPTVAFDVVGARDAVIPGETGLLVPRGDIDGFAGAAIGLALEEDRRIRLGAAAERRVRSLFDEDVVTARHVRYFLQGPGGRR